MFALYDDDEDDELPCKVLGQSTKVAFDVLRIFFLLITGLDLF